MGAGSSGEAQAAGRWLGAFLGPAWCHDGNSVTGYRKPPCQQGVSYREAYCRLVVYVYVFVAERRILGQRLFCNNQTRSGKTDIDLEN